MRRTRQPRHRAVEPKDAAQLFHAGARRFDDAGDPALAVHLAGGQADGAYPRPHALRCAARPADA